MVRADRQAACARVVSLLVAFALGGGLVPGRAAAQPITDFLGGSAGQGEAIVIDTDGSVFVAGQSTHADVATTPSDPCYAVASGPTGGDTAHGTAFVAKLDAAGVCQYLVYLGGTGEDDAFALALDGSSVYVTGGTDSPDFPASGTPAGAEDAWVARLDKATGATVWATLIGSSADDTGYGVAFAGANVYISGTVDPTSGTNVPLPATDCAAQPTFAGGQGDAFVACVDLATGALLRTTYLGGSDTDSSIGTLAADATGVYVTGATKSRDFPTSPGAFRGSFNANGTSDAFVTKLDPQLTTRLYSTFLGGEGNDGGQGIVVDEEGAAYVVGSTASAFPVTTTTLKNSNTTTTTSTSSTSTTALGCPVATTSTSTTNTLPTSTTSTVPAALHALRGSNGTTDAFVAKIDPTGTQLTWATHVGGSSNDRGVGLVVDAQHRVLFSGDTGSKAFVRLDAKQGKIKTRIYKPRLKSKSCPIFLRPCHDAFVMELDANGLPCAIDATGACPKTANYITPYFFAVAGGTGPDVQTQVALAPAGDAVWLTGVTGSDDNARCEMTPKPKSCKGFKFKPFQVTTGDVATPSVPPGFPGDDAVDFGAFLVEIPKP